MLFLGDFFLELAEVRKKQGLFLPIKWGFEAIVEKDCAAAWKRGILLSENMSDKINRKKKREFSEFVEKPP